MQEDVEEKEEGRKKFERKKRVAGKEKNGKQRPGDREILRVNWKVCQGEAYVFKGFEDPIRKNVG